MNDEFEIRFGKNREFSFTIALLRLLKIHIFRMNWFGILQVKNIDSIDQKKRQMSGIQIEHFSKKKIFFTENVKFCRIRKKNI